MSKDEFRERASTYTGDDFPDAWKPEIGDLLVGTLLEYEHTTTNYGPCWVARVEDEDTDEEVSVFIGPAALQTAFDAHKPRQGERIAIKRLEDGRSRQSGQRYKNFKLWVDRQGDDAPVPDFGTPDYDGDRQRLKKQAMTQADAIGPGAPGAPAPDYDDYDDENLPF